MVGPPGSRLPSPGDSHGAFTVSSQIVIIGSDASQPRLDTSMQNILILIALTLSIGPFVPAAAQSDDLARRVENELPSALARMEASYAQIHGSGHYRLTDTSF